MAEKEETKPGAIPESALQMAIQIQLRVGRGSCGPPKGGRPHVVDSCIVQQSTCRKSSWFRAHYGVSLLYHKLGSNYHHLWAALLSGHCFACTNIGGRGRRD